MSEVKEVDNRSTSTDVTGRKISGWTAWRIFSFIHCWFWHSAQDIQH